MDLKNSTLFINILDTQFANKSFIISLQYGFRNKISTTKSNSISITQIKLHYFKLRVMFFILFVADDPLWFERTAVRPSTSLRFSQRASDVLDPDSTVHASQMSDNWFENLSQSENSKLMHEAVKKNASKRTEGNLIIYF